MALAADVVIAYGFDEDPATRRLLRSRPPKRALAWAEAAAGGRVVSAKALRGGLASAVHRLAVHRPDGSVEQIVLRRIVRPEDIEDEPDAIEREGRTLEFVEPLALPTPALIAVDPAGEQAGQPALLMTHLRGRVDWAPPDMDRWLLRLAEILPAVHQARLPSRPGVIGPFAPYAQKGYEPPDWARLPAIWRKAVELFLGPTLDGPDVFIHRDFHPGNVLWWRGRVSGVIDWAAAGIGPASVDVGHCRGNLFVYSLEVADRFTSMWERVTGARYHPYGDVVAIIGFLDGLRDDPPPERFVVEEALARAVAELGGS
jgi:aminoglycoside phosphotransferase (APT) family kinase protein